VAALIDRQVENLIQSGHDVVFVDVPLLYEVGWEDQMDAVVLVYVPAEVQVERLMKRDQVDRAQALYALKAQIPIEQKLKKAQFLVDNQGSLEETRGQVVALWDKLISQVCDHRQPGNSEPTRK
jgi:dephospho-CoA kinase